MKDGTEVIASVNLNEVQLKLEALRLLPREICEKHCLLPLWVKDKPTEGSEDTLRGTLGVVIADPKNIFAADDVKFLTGYNVEIFQAPEADIRGAIARCYDAMEVSGSAPASTPRPRSGEMEVAIIEHLTGSSAGAGPSITQKTPKEATMSENSTSVFVNDIVRSAVCNDGEGVEIHFVPTREGMDIHCQSTITGNFRTADAVLEEAKLRVTEYVQSILVNGRAVWSAGNREVLSANVFQKKLVFGMLMIMSDFKKS